MGGGPDKETLLFIHYAPEPTAVLNTLRTNFPNIDVVYHHLSPAKPTSQGGRQMGGIPYSFDDIPASLWHSTTILVTLGILPPTPSLVPNLRYIHLLSAGVDHFLDHWIFTSTSIPVTTVSGIHGPPIAEWVTLAILALTKNFPVLLDNQRRHKWDSSAPGLMRRGDWAGKTVGICGYGSIGRQVARVFSALGSNVHAFTSSARDTRESRRDNGYIVPGTGDAEGTIPSAWYSGKDKADLHTFLATGLDAVVNCVPLTKGTKRLFGPEEFEVLGRTSMGARAEKEGEEATVVSRGDDEGCYFVNLSRGPTVQTDALVQALQKGELRGAALDVTDPEPLPEDSPLWDMENVIITPHISGLGRDYIGRSFDVLTENLRRRERGEKMLNEVNRETGYRSL